MLMVVKNQIKVCLLAIKYALIREMLNKVNFITNILFMILNNASFIVQWIVLYSLKDNIGGYTLNNVLLLWALASSSYGISHFFFKKAYSLSDTINTGKLDAYLVQPKNVLISSITSDVETSAIGDMLYGLILVIFLRPNIKMFLLFILFSIVGGISLTAISVISNSLSFWFQKSDLLADRINSLMTNFATYPEGIFKGITKILLYTIIPVGIVNYIPIQVMNDFNINLLLVCIIVSVILVLLSFVIFYKGLKRYSSSSLMISRI